MPKYNVSAATFDDGNVANLYDIKITPKHFKADKFGEHQKLCEHVAGLLQLDVKPGCMLHAMLGDVANGCCTVESRPDLLDAEAAPGTKELLFYLMPPCVYDDASECSLAVAAGKDANCECDGDVMIVTVEPS